ncbi:MAG: terminase family protein, partial [Pandoraea sp.]|nr:terminase family protein [Pandoraea sp.]
MTTPNPTLNVPQAEFLQMPHKFRAYVAGFGSGKTWVGCTSICQHFWQWPRINQGYFAPTYPQIRDIFYPTMEEVAAVIGFLASADAGFITGQLLGVNGG